MKNKRPSIDGFIPRRTGSRLGDLHSNKRKRLVVEAGRGNRVLHTGNNNVRESVGVARTNQAIGRSDIDESLREIDNPEPTKSLSKRERRRLLNKNSKPRGKVRRIIKWFLILLIIAGLAVGAYVGVKFLLAGGSIFKGNIFDIAQSQPLKQDENGRSNFLILGTSEDDPGHGGAYLTDSMMVLSVDQNKKNAYMFSIPRDLYVQYGMACNSGYAGKINEYFNCVNDDYDKSEAEQERLTKTQSFVGEILGVDIQYGIHVNNTVIKDAINAVGGVDVDIQGSGGEPGILDRNFDWRCKYKCYLVKYDNGIHHLDGEHALFLSMARGDIAPTYGLGNSNFDREKNQQKIIVALKDKAASTGTLTNLSKVTGLIDALGENLRTNIETKEIQTLMKLGVDIKTANIKSISLVDEEKSVVKSGNHNGASVVMPSAGIFNYSQIRAFIDENFSSNPVTREKAGVIVLNGSGVVGAGQAQADKLRAKGLIIDAVDNAPEGTYASVEIYQIDATKKATIAKLKEIYPKAIVKKTAPPIAVGEGTSFVVVIVDSQQ
ncbi:LCP family protein [Candidatus Saccharibacteria bacterium]|nr:LCP family protein [Candidatus Saccharibacteria bacterium]